MLNSNLYNKAPIQRLTPELLVNVARNLNLASIAELAFSCKLFSTLLSNDVVFRQLTERDYSINYKCSEPDETWLKFYKNLRSHASGPCCPHLSGISDDVSECKCIVYRASLKTSFRCDLCKSHEAVYLCMHPACNSEACRSCLLNPERVKDEEESPIQLEIATHSLWCFACQDAEGHLPRKLGGVNTNRNEQFKVKTVLDRLQLEDSEGALERRRKAEHHLYIQELRRENMSLKHYLLEKNWGRAWMLFRTREGSPLPGKITNNKLSRSNGSLDPSIRLPVDKYRPSPETNADIISEKLWSYLEKAYGVQGRAFSEDDMQYPEYTRLRGYIQDFKNSILAYP